MRDHKSLLAWQRARTVTLIVLQAGKTHWTPHSAAALSTQLNIAEGHALRAGRWRDHLVIAYGSAVETIELLELALDCDLIPKDMVQPALSAGIETRALLPGLIRKYRGK